MYKTQSNQIRKIDKKQYLLLRKLCWHSARLYNTGLYSIRQHFFDTKTFIPYQQNYHYCKNNENYEILPSTIAQQTLKIADRSFKSFFGLLKAKQKGKYYTEISIPKYLDKQSHFLLVIPTNGFQIKGNKIQIGISASLKKETGMKNIVLDFPTHIDVDKVKEVRIIPQQKATFFKMEIVYEIEKKQLNLNKNNVLSLDPGVSNLVTCYDTKNNRAFIVDGKKLKSINHYWNKQNAKLQSIKDKQGIKRYTKQQFLLKRKREYRVKDVMRKTAKYLIDYCIANDIGTIVMGHNTGWKQGTNMGKKNNQNFVQIPFGYLMSILESKCKEHDLRYLETQESHTSKCSCLDNEEVRHHDVYAGKRIKRGMFKSRDGILLNADVNGSVNIVRKSKVTSMEVTSEMIKGIVAYPLRIRIANE